MTVYSAFSFRFSSATGDAPKLHCHHAGDKELTMAFISMAPVTCFGGIVNPESPDPGHGIK
jgi:hypothetical protein